MTKYPLEWGWDQPETSKSSSSSDWKPKPTLLGNRGDDIDVAAAGDLKCEGGDCGQGGSWGTTGMYEVAGKILCENCAAKAKRAEDLPSDERVRILRPHLLGGP
jgi:hypothetical protein